MNITYLMTAEYLKQRMPIHGNVDDKLLNQTILDCQEMFVQELIGSGLYDELVAQIDAATLTALNTTLLDDYITPAMLQWCMAGVVKPISYRFTDVGVQKKETEQSVSISDDRVQTIEDDYRSKAQFYGRRLTAYLIENEDDYPLYCNPGTGVDVIHPRSGRYQTGLYTGSKRRRRVNGYDIEDTSL
jgi:hypothetical protein